MLRVLIEDVRDQLFKFVTVTRRNNRWITDQEPAELEGEAYPDRQALSRNRLRIS